MLRTARMLAIPASMLLAGSAVAGPYDAYKPPGVPPAQPTVSTAPIQTAQVDRVQQTQTQTQQTMPTETTGVTTEQANRTNRTTRVNGQTGIDGEKVAQNDMYVPPAPSQGVVIMDSSATTTVGQPVYAPQRSYQAPQPRQNMFQRMMELERRKNAWLRKTFLNR